MAERSEKDVEQQLDLVVVGHVDHGKSTVIGRLMADTGSLPEGKLEQVKATCARNAKPFEYAFLLDALKTEQAQGITIDTARCFFRTAKRYYIIHDAPGHVEFLKNMVTGAARAEAALLVIDAHEGIQENSKRHGYILSMLGLRQIAVLVNKMDLVGYEQAAFERVKTEYAEFLHHLGVRPQNFIPVAAVRGENIVARSEHMPWYTGPTTIEQVDAFNNRSGEEDRPLRMPVQDVYKFTEAHDERRIIAGSIYTGTLRVGDEVLFLPSGKSATVKSIEAFNAAPPEKASAGQATGFTLTTQLYVKPGELVVRKDQPPARVGTRFRANLFWMNRAPLIPGKRYKMKLGAARVPVELVKLLNVLDASELTSIQGKKQVDRHDVGECIFETARPVAFDLNDENEQNARFVIIDNFEIAGCGTVLEQTESQESTLVHHVQSRELSWERSLLSAGERLARYRHRGKFVVLVGAREDGTVDLARSVELKLFRSDVRTYFLSPANASAALGETTPDESLAHEEHLRRLGELARIITDAGLVFLTALDGVDQHDLKKLRLLNEPNELFVVRVGRQAADISAQLALDATQNPDASADLIIAALNESGILLDYSI